MINYIKLMNNFKTHNITKILFRYFLVTTHNKRDFNNIIS